MGGLRPVGSDPFGQPYDVPDDPGLAGRAAAWEERTGGTIEPDGHGWPCARDRAGILLGRFPRLGELMDRLESP